MTTPDFYWNETSEQRRARVAQQDASRASCVDDNMELVYSLDLDEVYAELLRLHRKVGEERTEELIRRVFSERVEAAGV